MTDTVANQSPVSAAASTTRYYLSLDPLKGAGDRLLVGSRAVPVLTPNATFPAPSPLMLTIPLATPPGTYFVLACADDARRVPESDELNNCKASAGKVIVK